MKKKKLFYNPYERRRKNGVNLRNGLVFYVILGLLLGLASVLGILGYAVKGSHEYNHMHQIARDIAEDPNSHTDEEINNAGEAFVNMASDMVDAGITGPGGIGVKALIKTERMIRDIKNQAYVIKISPEPANPIAGNPVTVTVTVVYATEGTEVNYSVAGSDGYTLSGTMPTSSAGTIYFVVEGGEPGVTDTITINVGSVTEVYTYTFHGGAAGVAIERRIQ